MNKNAKRRWNLLFRSVSIDLTDSVGCHLTAHAILHNPWFATLVASRWNRPAELNFVRLLGGSGGLSK